MDTVHATQVATRLQELFTDVGVRGHLHAADIDSAGEVGLNPDEAVVTASVFKIYVLLELCCQVSAGHRSLTDRVRIPAGNRTIGPTGLSVMEDAAELSLRDTAYLMMSVSDNHATDTLMNLIGTRAVEERIAALGLTQTAVPHNCHDIFRTMAEDLTGTDQVDDLNRVIANADPDRLLSCRALTPTTTDHTTPRETTTTLTKVWRDSSLPPDACAEVRRIMGQQVWPHRLSSGFPDSRIRVSGKTGTLAHVRNEVGVVEYPDGGRYAVAVFLRLPERELRAPKADAVIGRAAKIAVDHLREST